MTYVPDPRVYGTRVGYVDPEGKVVLGTTQTAPPATAPEDCLVVRFDGVPFTWVIPRSELRILDEEEELKAVSELNADAFAPAYAAIKEAHLACNKTELRYGKRNATRRARVEVRHDDIAGYTETWTITISAKSLLRKGL